MNNYRRPRSRGYNRRYGHHRRSSLGGVKRDPNKFDKNVVLGTALVFILFLIDEFTFAHQSVGWILVWGCAIWTTGLLWARPGNFGVEIQEYGLVNLLWSKYVLHRAPKPKRHRSLFHGRRH